MRWAQSPTNTFVEVKFATRFDSPACLDIFDSEIKVIDNDTLYMSAMCRNDKKLLKYELRMNLNGDVHPFVNQVDPKVLDTHQEVLNEYETNFEAFKKLNSTYLEKLSKYDKDMDKFRSYKQNK